MYVRMRVSVCDHFVLPLAIRARSLLSPYDRPFVNYLIKCFLYRIKKKIHSDMSEQREMVR